MGRFFACVLALALAALVTAKLWAGPDADAVSGVYGYCISLAAEVAALGLLLLRRQAHAAWLVLAVLLMSASGCGVRPLLATSVPLSTAARLRRVLSTALKTGRETTGSSASALVVSQPVMRASCSGTPAVGDVCRSVAPGVARYNRLVRRGWRRACVRRRWSR